MRSSSYWIHLLVNQLVPSAMALRALLLNFAVALIAIDATAEISSCEDATLAASIAQANINSNPEGAERVFLEALIKCQDVPLLSYNLGVALSLQGKFSESIQHFRTALAGQDTADFRVGLLRALIQSGANPDDVTRQFEEGMLAYPADVRFGQDLAVYFHKHHSEKSAELLKRFLALHPTENKVQRALGVVLFGAKDYSGALPYLVAAAEVEPGDVELSQLIGEVHYRLRDYQKALEVLKEVTERDPKNERAAELSAYSYREIKATVSAINAFQKAAEINPTKVDYWREIGELAFSIKDYDKALKAYQQTVALSPGDNNAHSRIGYILLQKNEPAKALAAFERVLAQDSTDINALYNSGIAAHRLGDLKKAQGFYEKTLKQDKNHAGAAQSLGGM